MKTINLHLISTFSPHRWRHYPARALLAFSFSAMAACAHTPTQNVFQNMFIAGTAGAIMGQQKEEYKNTHSTMYAGVAAALAGAVTLYIIDPDKEVAKITKENEALKIKLDEFQSPKVTYQFPATFAAKIPDKYRNLVNPGEWRVSEIDQWLEDGENRLLHQDKVMELIPPSLKPNN